MWRRPKQHEGQDEQRADHQPGHRRWQPSHLQLVGQHHGERELEQVVVAGAQELGPEERREAALAQQRELIGLIGGGVQALSRTAGSGNCSAGMATAPDAPAGLRYTRSP